MPSRGSRSWEGQATRVDCRPIVPAGLSPPPGGCRTQDDSAATLGERSIFRRFLLTYSRYVRRNRQNLSSLSHRFAIEHPSPTGSWRLRLWPHRHRMGAERGRAATGPPSAMTVEKAHPRSPAHLRVMCSLFSPRITPPRGVNGIPTRRNHGSARRYQGLSEHRHHRAH